MEAKHGKDFLQASEGFSTRLAQAASESENWQATVVASSKPGKGRKPVASVRPLLTRRSLSTYPLQPSPDFERLLDLHEASAILGMHWKTLEAKARGHEVPAFKLGKRWRFRLSSLNAWLERGINSNTTDHAAVTRQERCS